MGERNPGIGALRHRVAGNVMVAGRTASPFLSKKKSPADKRGFFCFYSISSEYHTGGVNRPNIFEGIVV
jgi:hypothetical protein